MERKSWKVDIDGSARVVTLDWTYMGGTRAVTVDGTSVAKSSVPLRWRSRQEFELDDHPAVVITRPAGRISAKFVISLEVDGELVKPEPGKSRWEA